MDSLLGSVGSSPRAHEAGLAHRWAQWLLLWGDQSGPLGSAGEEPEDHTPFPDAARRVTRNAAGRDEQKRSQEAFPMGSSANRAALPGLTAGWLGLPECTSLRPRRSRPVPPRVVGGETRAGRRSRCVNSRATTQGRSPNTFDTCSLGSED